MEVAMILHLHYQRLVLSSDFSLDLLKPDGNIRFFLARIKDF